MGKNFTRKGGMLLFVIALLASIKTSAQVSTYVFSQSSGTYTPITGGTVLGTATGNAIGTPSLDDENYTGITIPFTFNFDGTSYTALTVNSNGHVVFGTAGAAANYTPISSTGTYSGCISAAGRDLNSLFNISGYTGEIRYETIGTSPSQTFVVQYSNFRPYSTSTSTATFWRWNFQIRLHETTNAVDVVYDYNFVGAPASSTTTNEVGLRGPNNTFPTNVNNRLITSGTHTWATSVAGTANTSKCNYSTTLLPASGLTYTWTPVPVCSGTPTAGTTGSSANPVCSATSFNLSLSGNTTGVTGLTYQWISSPDGINYSNISGATSITRADTTTQTRYYRCIVTCSGLSDTSTALYITLSPANQCYCAATYSSGCGSGGADAVINVALGTLSNASGCAASPYYTYYNSVTVPNIQQTAQQTITISFSTDGTQYGGVWIDYNQDGDFDDAGEFVANNTVNAGASGVINLNFTVPLSATLGQTRLRVRGGNDAVLANTPCGASSSAWGETEDYLVNVTAAPPCVPATSLAAPSVTGTDATVTWTSSSGSTSTLEYGPTGFTPGSGTSVNNATSPYTITGLTSQTGYDVYVTDTCTGGTVASTSGPLSFTTTCSPFPYTGDTYGSAVVVNTFPFTETVDLTSPCYTDASPLRTGKDLFYKIVAGPCAEEITFSLCGSAFDTYLYIVDSANTTTIDESDDFCGLQSEITFPVTPGSTYYAIVEPYSSTTTVGDVEVTVTQVSGSPEIALSYTSPSCAGVADGSASVSITAYGNAPVTYAWSNGGSNDNITNISSGTYYVTVTTACGSVTDSVVVPAVFNATLTSITNATCNGGNNGAINVTVANGAQPYSFIWSNGSTAEDLLNLTAGTYCLTVTENGGCSATICGTVIQPAAIVITGTPSDALCFGASSGGVDIAVTGGTVATYSQSQTVDGVNLLSTSTITLTGTPAASTTGTLELSVFGDVDGTAANANDESWTFYDENGNQLAVVGATGNALDQCGNIISTVINVTPAQIAAWSADGTITFTATATSNVNLTLCGGDFVAADLSYSTSYTYAWSSGATTEDATGLAAGQHTVTVTDNSNCTATATFTVGQPQPIVPSLDSLKDVTCNGGTNGGVYVTIAGGIAPYSYSWSNGSSNEDLVGVPAGIYTGTITDDNGCVFTSPQIPISQPSAITIAITSDNISCNGAGDGSIDVTVSGGTPGYTYLWSNSSATEDLSGLGTGTYQPTVTDANGCTAVGASSTITEPAVLTLALDSVNNNPCNGDSHGGVYVTAGGGTTPYNFNWSNGATMEDVTQVVANTYTLTLTDANNCTVLSVSGTVTDPAVLTAAVDSFKNVSCNGGSNGAVYVIVSGGTSGYIYNWASGQISDDITGLTAGTYDLTATDANGCTVSATQALTAPAALSPTLDSIVDVKCFGGSTGGVYISVTGGTTPYNYSWSDGSTSQDLTGVPAGSYTGTLTDANGCTSTSPSLTVTQPASALAASSVATDQIQGGAQGSVNLSVSGGITPYTFNWSNGTTSEDLSSVAAGIYICTITDANGCTVTQKDTVDLVIGIENVVAAYSVNLYPNPTQNNVTVDVNLPVANNVVVEVYTVEGKLIRRMEEPQVTTAKFSVNFMDEAEGVYLARIIVAGNVSTHRIIVTK